MTPAEQRKVLSAHGEAATSSWTAWISHWQQSPTGKSVPSTLTQRGGDGDRSCSEHREGSHCRAACKPRPPLPQALTTSLLSSASLSPHHCHHRHRATPLPGSLFNPLSQTRVSTLQPLSMPAPQDLISPLSTANLHSTPCSAQSQPVPGTIPTSAWKTSPGATMSPVLEQEVAGCSLAHAHPTCSPVGRADTRLTALALTTVTPTPIIPARRSPQPSLRLLLFLSLF